MKNNAARSYAGQSISLVRVFVRRSTIPDKHHLRSDRPDVHAVIWQFQT